MLFRSMRLPPAPDPRWAQSPAPGAATAAAGLLALAVFAVLAVGAGAGAGPPRLDRAVTDWAVAERRGALTPAVRVLTDLGGTTGLTIGTVLVAALLLARRLRQGLRLRRQGPRRPEARGGGSLRHPYPEHGVDPRGHAAGPGHPDGGPAARRPGGHANVLRGAGRQRDRKSVV